MTEYNNQILKIPFMENTKTWDHNPVFPFNVLDPFRKNSTLASECNIINNALGYTWVEYGLLLIGF